MESLQEVDGGHTDTLYGAAVDFKPVPGCTGGRDRNRDNDILYGCRWFTNWNEQGEVGKGNGFIPYFKFWNFYMDRKGVAYRQIRWWKLYFEI